MNNISLFLLSALIWGSTWIMITFQLGHVAPLVSVVYRFSIASLLLFAFSLLTRRSFAFSFTNHSLIFIQGILLFAMSYWLTYIGITKINSALAAVLSTSMVYFNVVFSRIILGDLIKKEVLIGATVGVSGILMIFLPDLEKSVNNSTTLSGIGLLLVGSLCASLGNVLSAKNQRRNIPVIQANALGMGYAALMLAIVATLTGLEFKIDYSFNYLGSLLYLAVFGSVIAFGSFLTLLGRIGPDKAGYISLVYPMIALLISTIFEDYHWSTLGYFGVVVILLGNFIAMGKYRRLLTYFSTPTRSI